MSPGAAALVLVATPIGNLADLSPRAIEELTGADVIAAEDTRRTRALLSHAGIPAGRRLRAVHAHNEREQADRIVELVRGGRRVVYVSDAGMPGVADPGERLVRACLAAGLPVEVVPGPSALLAGLVLSGLPTGRFHFEGFLPRKGPERARRVIAVAAADATVVIFESPHRLVATLAELEAALGADRPAAVVREVSKVFEETVRGSLGEVAARVAAAGPRGEYVVVVGAAPASAPVDDAAIEAALSEHLAAGTTARDSSAAVARQLGVPRRRVYELAVALRGEVSPRSPDPRP